MCSPGVRDHGPGWWALSRRLFSRTFLTNFLGVLGQFEDFLVPRVFRPRGMCLKKCQIVIREQNFFFSDFEVIYAPFRGIGHFAPESLFGTFFGTGLSKIANSTQSELLAPFAQIFAPCGKTRKWHVRCKIFFFQILRVYMPPFVV